MSSPKIFAINFGDRFTLDAGFERYLLEQAFGSFEIAQSQESADIVLASVFSTTPVLFPERTIALIWENMRPNYTASRYSISSDFDSYGGRNCRLPFWYSQLQWPGLAAAKTAPGINNHGYEPLIDLDLLTRSRQPRKSQQERTFCCFIANNPEHHSLFCVERLKRIGQVDLYGNIANRPLRQSKLDILPNYRFNLCFENSIFPGYYTEKVVQAWAGDCIPLYYSDQWYRRDFNPRSFVNRIDFATLDDFVDRIAEINGSSAAFDDIFYEPLLTHRPTLDEAIDFLRRAGSEIMDSVARRRAVDTVALRKETSGHLTTAESQVQMTVSPAPNNGLQAPSYSSTNLALGNVVRQFRFRKETTDEQVMKFILVNNQYDLNRLTRVNELLTFARQQEAKGLRPLIVDAGANIGASAIYFLANLPNALVVAVEPDAGNFDLLSKNVAGLNVKPFHAAISSSPGRARVFDSGTGHWGYRTEVLSESDKRADAVDCLSINDIYQSHASGFFPFLVKIDIEGAERELFSANTEWVTRTPLIIIELHDWLLPKDGTSAPFLKCIAQLQRDFIYIGEDVYSVANSLDALAAY
jgi:FkbM family methyltransferase